MNWFFRVKLLERVEYAVGGFQPVAVAVEPVEQRPVATPVGTGATIAVHERHELIAGVDEFEQRSGVAVPDVPDAPDAPDAPDVSFVTGIGHSPESEPPPASRSIDSEQRLQ